MTISYEAQFKETKTKMEGCEFYGAYKEKWVGCSFPQIVYKTSKVSYKLPPTKGLGYHLTSHLCVLFPVLHCGMRSLLLLFEELQFFMFLKHSVQLLK